MSDPSRRHDGEVLWSVMIPVYNPSELLNETLRSVRAAIERAEGSFQVEIIDDASPSGSAERFARQDGLAVAYHRRPVNGGLAACWNDCIARARGRLVHILHQDDLVHAEFYAEMERLEQHVPEAGMLFCRALCRRGDETVAEPAEQDHAGLLDGWLEKISAGQRLLCPSVVVRRDTYARLGGYDPRLRFVIDWEMWIRIAASEPVAYLPSGLVEYRVHDKSETARLKAQGCITDDLAVAYRVVSGHFRGPDAPGNRRRALAFLVWCSWDAASTAERAANPAAARREALSAVRHWSLQMRPKQTLQNLKLLARTWRTTRGLHG